MMEGGVRMLKSIPRHVYDYLWIQQAILYVSGIKAALLIKYKLNIKLYLITQPKSVFIVRNNYWLKLTMKTSFDLDTGKV